MRPRADGDVLLSDVAQNLLMNARRLPLCYAILHFVAGLALLVLVLSFGHELPITFGAVIALCSIGSFQLIMFSVLYLKNAPTTMDPEDVFDMVSRLNRTWPFLVVALISPFVVMVFFIVAVILGGVNLTSEMSDARKMSEYYSIGMSVAMIVFETFPILVHHDLMVKIRLITATVTSAALAPPTVRRRLNNMERGLVSRENPFYEGDPRERLTVYEFLREQQRFLAGESTTDQRCPPPYSHLAVEQLEAALLNGLDGSGGVRSGSSRAVAQREEDKTTETSRDGPPAYLVGCGDVVASSVATQADVMPPIYSSSDNLTRIPETIDTARVSYM
ncbi:hypothetical protein BV898_18256 [Hypsibius exemplaris]|uniref:Transmembrane protein n=1 Tax=Hypsibius exemplaris TaxID=2072580 RepID=A0A9X6NIH1_HYPEX|nr:hypothetical protein BV898_18256 [Hypsibius exemplaris]